MSRAPLTISQPTNIGSEGMVFEREGEALAVHFDQGRIKKVSLSVLLREVDGEGSPVRETLGRLVPGLS